MQEETENGQGGVERSKGQSDFYSVQRKESFFFSYLNLGMETDPFQVLIENISLNMDMEY